mmetsp:Transcript_15777/g.37091  ORF Transcript_15777/g.37091 Transcript_15777/m.37091 type:complete len:812 (-) Transcript_15777:107-2542(-)
MSQREAQAKAESRPLLSEESPPGTAASAVELTPVPSNIHRPDVQPIVQFSVQIFFVEETEGKATLGISRMGPTNKVSKVRWETLDGSAKRNHQYKPCSGEIIFDVGESQQYVEVPIMEDDVWHATTEFKVRVYHPEGCTLGAFLHTARVKIIDNDQFPTNKFKDAVTGEDAREKIENLNGWTLLWEYAKLNIHQEGMLWRSLMIIIFDQLPNARLLLRTWLLKYMVDVVFNDDTTDEDCYFTDTKRHEAYVIAVLIIAPMIILQAWEKVKIRLDVKGRSTLFLRSNLIRKFMNYTVDSRREVDNARVQVAMLDDVDEMAGGYQALLDMVQTFGKIAVLAGFTLYYNIKGWWVVIFMPVAMLIWVSCRFTLFASDADSLPAKKALLHLVNEITQNYDLIVHYYQRPKINEMMLSRVTQLKMDEVPERLHDIDDEKFPFNLRAVFVSAYIALAAPLLLVSPEHRFLTLGTFLATLTVIDETTDAFDTFYEVLVTLESSFDPVRELTFFLNLPTDLLAWKSVNRVRRDRSKSARSSMRAAIQEGRTILEQAYLEDEIKIELKNVDFKFEHGPTIFQNLNLSVDQGKIVAIYGEHESGKTTLLQMLAHSRFPTGGMLFIPGHLRLLQVSQNYIIFETWSPWENLTFGIGHNEVDAARIRTILTKLGMTKTLELVQDDLKRAEDEVKVPVQDEDAASVEELEVAEGPFHWVQSLTDSEKSKLHVARALIANYEILVMDCPLASFGPEASKVVMGAVDEHVKNRGLGQPKETLFSRRPRTCFYTHEEIDDSVWADIAWEIKDRQVTVLRNEKEAHIS